MAPLSFMPACKTTPLDVVYAIDVAPIADAGADSGGATDASAGGAFSSGGTGGGPADDPTFCSTIGPGHYTLRSRDNGLCLGQGAPTTVFSNPGFLLNFTNDCALPARIWELTATTVPNVYSLRNGQAPGYVLDVRMAAIADGTPVITFGENGYDNQRFEVRARDTFAYELRPQHHPQSCVGAAAAAAPSGAQITTCDPNDSTQAWFLRRSECQ